jgi:hypothetical protein
MDIVEILYLPLPRFLSGMRFGDWLALLRERRWRVDAAFFPGALLATVGTLVTSLLTRCQRRFPLRPADQEAWQEPLFVLGFARSGTTHLFQLLANDPRFCFPTRFDCFNPHTFRTLRAWGIHRLFSLVPAQRRAMDGVTTHWLSPEEDSIALSILVGRGGRLDGVFPREEPAGMPAWAFEEALAEFTRNLVSVHGKPVLLKSPSHVGYLRSILNVFPRARFVMIYRDPRAVVASMARMVNTRNRSWCTLQWPPPLRIDDLLPNYARQVDLFFRERHLIPPGRLVEIRHEDLVADEAGTIARLYDGLGLDPPPAAARIAPGRAVVPRGQGGDSIDGGWLVEAFGPIYDKGIYSRPDGV